MEQDPELSRRRQAIVKYPFGTKKRQWGFNHILSKNAKKRASAEYRLYLYSLQSQTNIKFDG